MAFYLRVDQMQQLKDPDTIFENARKTTALELKAQAEADKRRIELECEERKRMEEIKERERMRNSIEFLIKLYGLSQENAEVIAQAMGWRLTDLIRKWPSRKRWRGKNGILYRENQLGRECTRHNPLILLNNGGWWRSSNSTHKGYCGLCLLVMTMTSLMKQVGSMREATIHDYNHWMAGFAQAGGIPAGTEPHQNNYYVGKILVAQSDFELLPVQDLHIIIPKGVKVRNQESIGESTTLFFMDGFRLVGNTGKAIVYKDTLDPSSPGYKKRLKEALPPKYYGWG